MTVNIDEFKQFHEALTTGRPDYKPWYFLLNGNEKDPIEGQGWKAAKHQLSYEAAVRALEMKFNVGIAGTDMDGLVIIDVDDEEAFKNHLFIPTLTARSSSRVGRHHFYFTDDKLAKVNIALEDKGEIRAYWQYVVAPGSYAKLSDSKNNEGNITRTKEEKFEKLSDEEKPLAGMYTLLDVIPAANISYEDFPQVFKDEKLIRDAKEKAKTKAKENRPVKEYTKRGNNKKSSLYDLEINDVITAIPDQGRHPSLFHDSHTGKNTSISDGLLHCWRHNVSHNAISALAVLAGLADCVDAGTGHRNSGSGSSCIDYDDGRLMYDIWKYAKDNQYLPGDDPIPTVAIRYIAIKKGYCKEADVLEGWKIPIDAYIQGLKDEGLFVEQPKADTNKDKKKLIEPITSEIIQEKLKLIQVDEDPIKKLEAAIKFIDDELAGLEKASKNTIITNYVKEHFGFTSAQIRDIISNIVKKDKAKLSNPDIPVKTQQISKYFDEKNIFIPKELGDEILKEFDILTYRDTKELAVYIKGVFSVEGGEDALRVSALKKLGDDFKRERLNEVIEYIKLNTLVNRSDINPDNGLINLKNGMYNIKENKLIPHDIKYKSTIQLNVVYDEDAQCPEIDKFLHEIAKEKDIPVLVQYTGYSCTQDIKHQRALMIEGPRANGKSTFIELVCSMIGQEHVAEQSIQALNNDRFARAQLNGKLINMFPDLPKKKLYDNSVFKMLTTDKWIDGEEKYIRKFRFKNTIHQIYSANQVPDVDDPDEMAYFRRWIITSFPNMFEGKDADKKLLEKLTTEKEIAGFFNICMVGLRALIEHDDFCNQPTVEETKKLYLIKSNPVRAFLDECIEYSDYDFVKQDLFDVYESWCDKKKITNNIKDNAFGRTLKKMGYEDHRQTSGQRLNVWLNIGISFTGMIYEGVVDESVIDTEITLTDSNISTDNDYTTIRQGSRVNESIVAIYEKIYIHAYVCAGNNNVCKKEYNTKNPGTLTDAKKQYEEATQPLKVSKRNPDGLGGNSDGFIDSCDKSHSNNGHGNYMNSNLSQRDVAKIVIDTIRILQVDSKAKLCDIMKFASQTGITEDMVEQSMKHLKRDGRIFEPVTGQFKLV